ncbi:MAG TPA: GNAT family N-acetyltransferase [Fimbriimonadaceae bacterium]|nr:GNAT family N-acetyltransferase [Fimbriimonadaceae bacterium]
MVLPDGRVLRRLAPSDDLVALTDLLHRSYKRLADMGLRFVATHQSPETTRERAEEGECWVVEEEGRLIATITVYPPDPGDGTRWYDRGDVAHFGQFAVEPELQAQGIGSMLIELAEERARAFGATELALDTSEQAGHLIDYYEARGFRFIEHVQWRSVNYRSVVMSKTVATPPSG